MALDPEARRRQIRSAALRRFLEERSDAAQAEEAAANREQVELLDAAIAWLEEKWGAARNCPYCGSVEWEVGTPVEVATGTGDPLTPVFPVMCSNCGNTVFINAVRAGLVPEPEEP